MSLNIGAGLSLHYCRNLLFALAIAFGQCASAAFAADVESVKSEQKGVSPSQLKDLDAQQAPANNLILKPGQPVSVGMKAQDICVTDDVNLAREQAAAFPDSPDASFILAVALTRTSMVEQALAEVRHARRLAEKEGGPAYFDKMIASYEDMLKEYPNDNRVRYGLAWAYYMKAYVLQNYSKGLVKPAKPPTPVNPATPAVPNNSASSDNNPQITVAPAAPAKDWRPLWVSALATGAPGQGSSPDAAQGDSQPTPPYMKGALENAPPAVVPQIRAYYQAALKNLDELLQRNPNDVWALVYRAFLNAEYCGDLKDAMQVWRACQIKYPDNPAPYFFLGEGYLKEGNLKESLSNISRAVALRAIGK